MEAVNLLSSNKYTEKQIVSYCCAVWIQANDTEFILQLFSNEVLDDEQLEICRLIVVIAC